MDIKSNSKERDDMKKIVALLLVLVCILSLVACSTDENTYDNPFRHLYTVSEVLYSNDSIIMNTDDMLIELSEYQSLWMCTDIKNYDYYLVGDFENVDLEDNENSQDKALWNFYTDEEQIEQYTLQITNEDKVILSFLKEEQLQWQYQLNRVDMINCNVSSLGSFTTIFPDWFFPNTFEATADNLIYLSGADISGRGTVILTPQNESIKSITIYETYFTDGNVEYNEYKLESDFKNEKDFNLSVSTRYETGKQFAIYRIPYGEVECWFYLKFN